MKDSRFPDWMEFFPAHPSDEKTEQLKTTPSPLLEGQTEPLEIKQLVDAFEANLEENLEKYVDKRVSVTGIAIEVGLDMHNLPSVQLSDRLGGQCCALCIFPEDSVLSKVKVGDRVVILGNYLVYCHPFGLTMKYSELVEA